MFEINHQAEIRAINIAKGSNEDAPVCVTIGLDFNSIGAAPVAAALGCRPEDLDAWFSAEGDFIFTGITHIESWVKFEDEHELSMLRFRCQVAKISAVKIQPRGNKRFDMSCNVQLQDPPEHVIEKIAAALHETRKAKLTHQEQLPLDEQKAA